jgi:hypothetical protein
MMKRYVDWPLILFYQNSIMLFLKNIIFGLINLGEADIFKQITKLRFG